MPYRYPAAIRGYIIPLVMGDFTGGLNLRDYPSEIANNESPACENVTIDARGGVTKRLGLTRINGTGAPGAINYKNIFFWQSKNMYVIQDNNRIIWTTDLHAYNTLFTAADARIITFVEFQQKLVIAIPGNGIYVWDGVAATPSIAQKATRGAGGTVTPNVGPTTIRPTGIAAWQNKVWVIQGPKFYASVQGDPMQWVEDQDYNNVFEKDSLPLTAIGGGQGMDISGRPGLLVFKADSTYRINESRSTVIDTATGNPTITFGAYTTTHNHAGAAGPLAVITASTGQTCQVCQRGIYFSDGTNAPVLASGRIEPFFSDEELNFSASAIYMWAAGRYEDRVVFSLTRGSSSVNNYTLEFHPIQGWIVPHSFGMAAYTENLQDVKHLIGCLPNSTLAYQVFRSGTDDGQPIAARWQSRWFEPFAGYAFRMRRLRVVGRGQFNLFTKVDYTQSEGVLSQFQSFDSSSEWGNGIWGEMLWGSKPVEAYQDFFSLGHGKSVSFVIQETSGDLLLGPPLNDTGAALETGAFTFYSAHLDMVRFGYS